MRFTGVAASFAAEGNSRSINPGRAGVAMALPSGPMMKPPLSPTIWSLAAMNATTPALVRSVFRMGLQVIQRDLRALC